MTKKSEIMEEINTLCKSFITNKEYQTPDSIVFISGERIQFDLDNFFFN